MLAPVACMYLVVLAFCHLGVRDAMRDAVMNELRAQRLLDDLGEANDALSHEATHDLLTGIANRRRIIGELEAGLARIGKDIGEIAVLFVDLDGFKAVNDTYGHAVGDDLLVFASERISDLVGKGDLVGRQGGDEFIVLVRSAGRAEVTQLAERIRSALESSFRIGDHFVAVSASIGLVWCDRVGLAADDVLRDADVALYRAKDHGRNCVIEYRRNGPIRVDDRTRSVAELREALHDQVIRPYFQPIVDLDSGRIVGAEALARWPQPDGTVLAPAQFLRALTEAGLDTDLGIHMALQIMTLRSEIAPFVPEEFRLGLNVTFRRSRAKDVIDALAAMKSWVTPTGGSVVEGMMLELTENVAVRDLEETRRELERARSLGLAVALDDFGTGHSSLTLVRQLPLDVIKIDRCFVDGVADDRANEAVVSAVVHLANGVGAKVVAEGVERVDDALRLRELGCSLAQGFLYAPAVPGDTLRGWLEHGAPWQQPISAAGADSTTRTPLAVTPR
jgi:diguanylate cyclase